MVASQQDKQQIESLVQKWKVAHEGRGVDTLKSMWDQEYPHVFGIFEENNDALVGWDAMNTRYEGMRGGTGRRELDIRDVRVDVVGDVAYAYLNFVMTVYMKPFDRDLEFDGRFTFLFRRKGNDWKFIHYHESLSKDKNQKIWGFMWE